MTDIADESYNREMAGYNFYARHRPDNPDIPDSKVLEDTSFHYINSKSLINF